MKKLSRALAFVSCVALSIGIRAQEATEERPEAKNLLRAKASYEKGEAIHQAGVPGASKESGNFSKKRSTQPPMADLDNVDRLRRLFQSDKGKVRLMALLSPT